RRTCEPALVRCAAWYLLRVASPIVVSAAGRSGIEVPDDDALVAGGGRCHAIGGDCHVIVLSCAPRSGLILPGPLPRPRFARWGWQARRTKNGLAFREGFRLQDDLLLEQWVRKL